MEGANHTTPSDACDGPLVSDGVIVRDTQTQGFGLTRDGNFVLSEALDVHSFSFAQALHSFDMLVVNGTALINTENKLRAPRTVIGVGAHGELLMFQVDGIERLKIGPTLADLATWCVQVRIVEATKRHDATHHSTQLGFQWAINLDGGGSSTVVYKGKLWNDPKCHSAPFGRCVRDVSTMPCIK